MSGAAFLRIKKLKGGNIISTAARHNKREIQAERGADGSIEPTRSHLNESLHGPATADAVGQLAKDLMADAGVPAKRRKDAVMGLELVFSLPPNHQVDEVAYFSDCVQWAVNRLGGALLSADIHRDEATPHCHALLLPLVNNRMAGSDLMGGPAQLAKTLNDFHAVVAAKHGLHRAPKRLQGASKQTGAAMVLNQLKRSSDAILKSGLWPTVRDQIERDPAPWLLALGVDVPEAKAKPSRTFTQIMTSKGAGPSREQSLKGFGQSEKANPLSVPAPEKKQTLSCVRVPISPRLVSPSPSPSNDRKQIAQAALQSGATRHQRTQVQPQAEHTDRVVVDRVPQPDCWEA